jgi:hypothetical protein
MKGQLNRKFSILSWIAIRIVTALLAWNKHKQDMAMVHWLSNMKIWSKRTL